MSFWCTCLCSFQAGNKLTSPQPYSTHSERITDFGKQNGTWLVRQRADSDNNEVWLLDFKDLPPTPTPFSQPPTSNPTVLVQFVLVIVFRDRVTHHLIQMREDGMYVNNKSCEGAQTLPQVISYLRTRPKHWPADLIRFVPKPESTAAPAPAAPPVDYNSDYSTPPSPQPASSRPSVDIANDAGDSSSDPKFSFSKSPGGESSTEEDHADKTGGEEKPPRLAFKAAHACTTPMLRPNLTINVCIPFELIPLQPVVDEQPAPVLGGRGGHLQVAHKRPAHRCLRKVAADAAHAQSQQHDRILRPWHRQPPGVGGGGNRDR